MTKYRTYDYTTGRFMQVDPLTDQAGQEIYTPYQYSFNNPIRYNDPYGDCPKCWALAKGFVDFANGAVNAVASNNTTVVGADGTVLVQGFKREERGSTAFRIGQKFGDALSVGQGAIEVGLGAGAAGGSATGGVVTSSTGVGAVVGTAGAIGGIVISAHGANTMYNGFNNMLNADGNSNEGGRYAPTDENGNKPGLSKDQTGKPTADPEATGPRTTLGTREGRKGTYTQGAEFDGDGNLIKKVEHTDHGRPQNHPNPHQHWWQGDQGGWSDPKKLDNNP
ncbi:hypothetical protein JMN32_14965 [Fulvivirga sp. 29W222]|uniref:RHS repeat-associated core domain-containing protein n=2 Tax=Fulvivirga marina TaxID=2494733 RepID=A0A937KCK5_9BACT|nr:hypothetical protein [Fulvivirga marina]